jgi:hypothetical protein
MVNKGTLTVNGKELVVQVSGREGGSQIYIDGYPVEQYPRKVRDEAVRTFGAVARTQVC